VDVIERLRRDGILLPPPVAGFDTYVRVSLARPEEMQAFWATLDLINVRHSSM
jgi:hypothetical protein